jgi:hypothetical protein
VGEGAIDDLIDCVDRFFLTSAATKNENLGDEVILHIAGIVGKLGGGLSLRNQVRDAHGLSATAAEDSPEMLSGGGGRHQ